MNKCLKIFAGLVILLAASLSKANTPTFQNLTQSDYEGVLKDISGSWAYTSVSGPSSLGHLFGFEVGLEAGTAKTPTIDNISTTNNGPSISSLPYATIFGAVTVPFGITVETSLLPQTTVSGVTAKSGALAVKWTFTDLIDLPVDMAVKVFGSRADFSFSGPMGSPPVQTTIDITDNTSGFELLIGKKFPIVEPYLILGAIRAKGDTDVTGSTTVFNTAYTQSQSASETVTGNIFAVGADVSLLFVKLGIEAGKTFGNSKVAAKVSVYF